MNDSVKAVEAPEFEDLSAIEAKPREVNLRHPVTDEETGFIVTMLPESSEEVRRVKRQTMDRRLQSRKQKVTAEQIENAAVDLLVAACVAWRFDGKASWKGQRPPFNEKNLRAIICDPKAAWVKNQLDAALGDEGAFFQS